MIKPSLRPLRVKAGNRLSVSFVVCAWVLALPAVASAQTSSAEAALQGDHSALPSSPESKTEDQAIIVTGSRLGGGFKAPTPVTVVGEQRITALAATNLGDVMNRLPAFRMATAPTTALSSTGSGGNLGARYLDLRGLGASRTLVLVDGRRFVPSSILNSVDTNLIPALLVKRVEIVTGGASAAYGSDAVAGVVNILLDKEMEGFRAQAQAGISQSGDAGSRQVSLAGGTGFAGGRGHIVVGGEWSEDDAAGGCYTRDWCANEWGAFQNAGFKTNGLPASIWTRDVRSATMTQTGIINSPGALRGTTFNPDGTVRAQPFQYGATPGVEVMIGGEGKGSNWRLAVPYLKIPVQRISLFSNLEYDLTDDLKAFVTASYGQTKAQNRGATLFERGLNIRSGNPFIPAELQDKMTAGNIPSFVLGRLGAFILDSADIDPTTASSKSQTFRFATGLEGSLGGSWHWDGYYQYGRSDYRIEVHNVKNLANFPLALDAVAGPNGPMCRSTLTDPGNGCEPLNLFGTGRFSEAAFNYAFGTPWQEQHIRQHVAALNVRGDVVDLWAGPLSVAGGIEYRRDIVKSDADAIGQALGWQYGNGALYTGRINTKEGYLETSLPLARDMSFAKLLEFNGAIRLTDYSTSGTVTTWKAGLVYEPIDGVRFRATRSRDIRAPNAQELFNPGGATPGNVVDRATNIGVIARVRTGGNPNLQPEFATTWTAGVVLTPGGSGLLRPLRLSVDWFDISLSGAIASLGAQQIVDRCFAGAADLCGQITRGADGIITEVRATQLNLNSIIARGIDAELGYRVELGSKSSVDFSFLGTYNKDLITVDSVGPIDRAGQTGMQNLGATGVPRWSVTSTTTIKLGPVTTTIENRYIPKGIYDPTLIGPEDAGYDTTLPTSISRNRVSGRLYTNLGVQVAVSSNSRTQFEVYGFVGNLFNQDPPISPGSTSTNPALFDTIGRTFQAGVRVRY